MNVSDQLLALLRAGKDVVLVDHAPGRRREIHGYLVARRLLGETHAASSHRYRTLRAAGGSIEISETVGGLKGAMVDVVLFAATPTPHERQVALAAVSVRGGDVRQLEAT